MDQGSTNRRNGQNFVGGCRDIRTAELVRIFKVRCWDPRIAESVRILKRGLRDPRTAESVRILKEAAGIQGLSNWSEFFKGGAGIGDSDVGDIVMLVTL